MDKGFDRLCSVDVVYTLIAIIFSALFYWKFLKGNDYWKKRGLPCAKPYPFFYFLEYYLKGIESMDLERYKNYGRVFGYYEGNTPQICIGDPELLKNIFVKDFHYFPNKRVPMRYVIMGCKGGKTGDPIADKTLPIIRDEDWKRIRTIITPTFSTTKIKKMIGVFEECAKVLLQNIKMELAKKSSFEVESLYEAFTMDVITNSAFSANVDSLKNPENKFVKMARAVTSLKWNFQRILFCLVPRFAKTFGLHLFTSENQFFKEVTLEFIQERRKTGQTPNDFLQTLMNAADETVKENLLEETTEERVFDYELGATNQSIFKGTVSKQLSIDELVAQCITFFLGGHHTASIVLNAVTYHLMVHQDVQKNVFQEIETVLKETNGVMTYEALQEMTYLDSVISETLRLCPPVVRLERQAAADYKLGDTGITIPKDMVVSIPTFAMHRDPNFFPEPEKFKPDRFSPEGKKIMKPYTFLPFGAGPRICVAYRFAILEVKTCLVHLLSVFHIKKCSETQPLTFGKGVGLLKLNPIRVLFEERKDCPLLL